MAQNTKKPVFQLPKFTYSSEFLYDHKRDEITKELTSKKFVFIVEAEILTIHMNTGKMRIRYRCPSDLPNKYYAGNITTRDVPLDVNLAKHILTFNAA